MAKSTKLTPQQYQTSLNSIMEMMAEGRKRAEKRIQENKHILFDVFDANGVQGAEVNFDGSGDSGGVESIQLSVKDGIDPNAILVKNVTGAKVLVSTGFSQEGMVDNLEQGPVTINLLIESICYDALKATHEGWENNDGAYGDIQFDCERREVYMNYYERSTEHHEHGF